MGSIGNYDSELCQSGRSVFEWLWVLVGVGAGGARGAFYLPMVRPSSYVASSSSLLTNIDRKKMVRPLRASSSSYVASSSPPTSSSPSSTCFLSPIKSPQAISSKTKL